MSSPGRSGYPVRRIRLEDEGVTSGVEDLSPSQRVALVWQLTVQAWAFKDGRFSESRLRRDVVRTLRDRE